PVTASVTSSKTSNCDFSSAASNVGAAITPARCAATNASNCVLRWYRRAAPCPVRCLTNTSCPEVVLPRHDVLRPIGDVTVSRSKVPGPERERSASTSGTVSRSTEITRFCELALDGVKVVSCIVVGLLLREWRRDGPEQGQLRLEHPSKRPVSV